MTPYQVGFLASRVLAVLCFMWALDFARGLPSYFELLGQTSNESGRGLPAFFVWRYVGFQGGAFVLATSIAAILWLRADRAARALCEQETIQTEPLRMSTETLALLAFRVLGLYVLVTQLGNFLFTIPNGIGSIIDATRHSDLLLIVGDALYYVGSWIAYGFALYLFFGYRRNATFFASSVKRVAGAAQAVDRWMTLPEPDDPKEPPK